MREIVQWITDPVNHPLDMRWEDLPVELRIPPMGVAIDASAEILEVMTALKRSDGKPYFPTVRDALVSRLLAHTPRANCWVGRVRVRTLTEFQTHDALMNAFKWALSCSDDEPDPTDPVCPEPAELPGFWSDKDWKDNMQELKEIEQESLRAAWDSMHPEERCPPRE